MKTILILSVISIAMLDCGDSGDNSSPIIHHVVTPEPTPSEDFPEVPEGFPPEIKPVWLEDWFDEGRFADHVIMSRVLIELWNQGERGFVNVVGAGIPVRKVSLYPDVVYVQWREHDEPGPDGEPLKYISYTLGTRDAVRFSSDLNSGGGEVKLFTEEEMEEMMAGEGAYMAQYPGLKLVDYKKAGYKPKDVLVDYCNQPGNRARVPYCR